MRQIRIRAFLFSMLLSMSFASLHAQDSGDGSDIDDQPGLMTEGTPGIGNLLPMQDLLSDDESLATENGPAPGDIPVDGGLSLLLAAGAAIGVSRLRRGSGRKD
jgi:hypothetical protein